MDDSGRCIRGACSAAQVRHCTQDGGIGQPRSWDGSRGCAARHEGACIVGFLPRRSEPPQLTPCLPVSCFPGPVCGQSLNERGEKLSELGDKTNELQNEAANFYDLARQLRQKNEKKKWYEL